MSTRTTLPLLLLALLLLGGGLLALLGGGKPEPTDTSAPRPGSAAGPGAPALVEPSGPNQRSELDSAGAMAASQRPEGPAHSTVLWPLRVELECVARSSLPELADGQRVGAGATARLAGRIVDSRGRGVEATISFVAGQNLGRVLHCDSEGRLGASDLYAGLDVIEVAGPGIIGSRRELRLRRGSESLLNIGYGRLATVYGTVLGPAENASAAPVVGARVRVDGQEAWTDERGQFYVPAAASGKVLLEIEKEGLASYSTQIALQADRNYLPGVLEWRMRAPGRLRVSVPEAIGAAGPAQLYVLPSETRAERSFPFHELNPIEIHPGSTLEIDGLPAQSLTLQLFHAGATAKPQRRLVNLRSDHTTSVELHLEPAPSLRGRIVRDGQPVAGASVRLEPPDRTAAMLAHLRETSWYLESEVLAPMPISLQTATSNGSGEFTFTGWTGLAPTRWLEAVGPDGSGWAGCAVVADEEFVELELGERPAGDAQFLLHMPGRFQGLPIELVVNGAPQDPFVLPDFESLRVEGLARGTWRVRVSWYTEDLLGATMLELEPEGELTVSLPNEAKSGHTPEQWRRAGRVWPGS